MLPATPASPAANHRSQPHRRNRTDYRSPSIIKHTKTRRKFFNNFETLNENYGMDTNEVQFVVQDFFYKFERMSDDGNSLWKKIKMDKKRIVWVNPNNGFAIAALKDLDFEIKLPNSLPTYEENFDVFKSLWISLEHDVNLLFENIRSHLSNNEYCCMDCHFPFATVCSELYTQFEPDPPR